MQIKLFIHDINEDYLSYESVRQYKGLCALSIFLYHLSYTVGLTVYNPFTKGDRVVALFFCFPAMA